MNGARRAEDQRVILNCWPAVRSEVALTLASSCLEHPVLRANAIEVTAARQAILGRTQVAHFLSRTDERRVSQTIRTPRAPRISSGMMVTAPQ